MTKFTITWRNERGQLMQGEQPIVDDRGVLDALLPRNDPSYHCLSYIDRHGVTIFAEHQMRSPLHQWATKNFIFEWQRLRNGEFPPEVEELLSRIETLARCCQRHGHTQLWFEAH